MILSTKQKSVNADSVFMMNRTIYIVIYHTTMILDRGTIYQICMCTSIALLYIQSFLTYKKMTYVFPFSIAHFFDAFRTFVWFLRCCCAGNFC